MALSITKNYMTKGIKFVDFHDKVINVANFMYKHSIGSIIIKRGGASEGIMTEKDIIRHCVMGARNIFNTSVGEIMSQPIVCISEDTPMLSVCHNMKERSVKKLIALNKEDKIDGIITMTDIINNLKIAFRVVNDSSLRDIMTKEVFYSDYDDKAMDVTELMRRNKVGSIIIMNKGIPVGIITERDIVKNCVIGEKNFAFLKAKDIMSGPVITIGESKTIIDAANIMKDKNIKKLLVINESSQIAGIVTQTDIVYNIGLLL